ncbi:MAG: 4-phospho-D-threonate 3-dehydrogenase / 4-phospho-D-erythronate 3-dehydrogenase [Clostridiales bacterium]|nr:4-phospho-D-threonate 3-dehydrogenase / 4-phospho-D-erythronate 3-dehydrogenase [Clostridiales bacterium]MDK2933643.1 4-phospho-D-threonate 3-dehydrogenase / 4-phospho-D-erythronate 3-dehydrogenase [Clostridiales bacterium]
MKKPVIGITMGDAAGIGPEIICKALTNSYLYDQCNPIVLGDAKVINQIIKICGLDLQVNPIKKIDDGRFKYGVIDVLDYDNIDMRKLKFGVVSSMCGKAAVKYTIEAGNMAINGEIAAMVSAPLHKEAMREAGFYYEGQTQILGELTASKNYGMMLILNDLKLMMYSTHMSLVDACKAVTYDGILKKIQLAHQGLKFFDLENPMIAVSALNPHCGEGGLFGKEEIDSIIPAVEQAKSLGINVVGPISADTVFVRAKNGEFDLVLSLYHDQANIAMKLLGFGNVVTLLAGLPIIRTSTGHGTAFDIAGKNIANATNLVKAIELAAMLGAKRI